MFQGMYKYILFIPFRVPLGLFTYLYNSPALNLVKNTLNMAKTSLYSRVQKKF